MASIHLSKNNILSLAECYTIGHYRGEDSGAIYPDYDFRTIKMFDLNSIKDKVVETKTIEQLVRESCSQYPYEGEMFTSPQARKIYTYIQTLPNISELEITCD